MRYEPERGLHTLCFSLGLSSRLRQLDGREDILRRHACCSSVRVELIPRRMFYRLLLSADRCAQSYDSVPICAVAPGWLGRAPAKGDVPLKASCGT